MTRRDGLAPLLADDTRLIGENTSVSDSRHSPMEQSTLALRRDGRVADLVAITGLGTAAAGSPVTVQPTATRLYGAYRHHSTRRTSEIKIVAALGAYLDPNQRTDRQQTSDDTECERRIGRQRVRRKYRDGIKHE